MYLIVRIRQWKKNSKVEKNIVCIIELACGSESGIVWREKTLCFFCFCFMINFP